MIGRQLAKRLEVAKLWHPGERDGEPGWQFHQWTEHQRTREQVLSERSAAADRQATARKRANERKQAATDARHASDLRDIRGESDRSHFVSHDPSHADSHGVTHAPVTPTGPDRTGPDLTVVPTELPEVQNLPSFAPRNEANDSRPSATEPTPGTQLALVGDALPAKSKRGTRLRADWVPAADLRAWAAETLPGYDTRAEHSNFVDYWIATPGAKGVKLDWPATWRTWMRRAAERSGWRPGVPSTLPDGRNVNRKTAQHLDHLAAYGDDHDRPAR